MNSFNLHGFGAKFYNTVVISSFSRIWYYLYKMKFWFCWANWQRPLILDKESLICGMKSGRVVAIFVQDFNWDDWIYGTKV
jgi:hypothetical protein